jgi:hypothetical protein
VRNFSVEPDQDENDMDSGKISRKIGFLSTGWWIIHLSGISVVYALGHILWR